jgi:membrane protein DedA with SNARE-associated domain
LCRSEAALPARLAIVAYVEAALLVGVALTGVMETDTPYNVFSLLTGALVGPLLAFWLGHHLGAADAEHAARPAAAAT